MSSGSWQRLTFGVATWVVPLLRARIVLELLPRSSLGAWVSPFVFLPRRHVFLPVGVWLALFTLVFAQDRTHAWVALFLIGVFWLWVAVMLYLGDRRRQQAKNVPRARPKRRFRKRIRKRSEGERRTEYELRSLLSLVDLSLSPFRGKERRLLQSPLSKETLSYRYFPTILAIM